MRLFFVVKAMQMINSFLTISLLLGTYRLCGKTSLDRILSRPNSSCVQFVQNLFLKNRLPSNERNHYSRQNHNKTVVSYEYLENKTTEVSNDRTNNSASSEHEEMTPSNEIFESYSCITIDLKESCFLWRNSGHKLPCQAVSGMTFPVSIVAIDLIYLICTIISVTRSILPLSRIFSVTNVIVYCVEIFYSKWLYMRIRLFIKPGKMALAAGKAVTRVMHRCEAAKASGYLDLSDCGVMYIADAIYLVLKGYEINKCNLRNNSLTKFPKKMVERFSNMTMFNVEGNAIEEFPVEVGEWTAMQGMNLSNNKLTTFPVGIFNMKQLTYLDLSGNNITEIDVDRLYTSLPNLTQLLLSGNPVAETMKTELENHKKKPKTLKLLLI